MPRNNQKIAISFLLLLICWLICWSTPTNGQTDKLSVPQVQIGTVQPHEFKSSSTDTTAEAVILYESGDVSFSIELDGKGINFTRHIRILIRKRAGLRRANVSVNLARSRDQYDETFKDFRAFTHNLTSNGQVETTELNSSALVLEKASAYNWIAKFALTNVREGSVIEYAYTIRTPMSIRYLPSDWRFQDVIPTDWSQYHIVAPDQFPYQFILSGPFDLFTSKTKRLRIYFGPGNSKSGATESLYAMKNVPAYEPEAFMTSNDDNIAKLSVNSPNTIFGRNDVGLTYGWDGIDLRLSRLWERDNTLKPTRFFKNLVAPIIEQYPDSLARLMAVYNLVRTNISWNGEESVWCSTIKDVWTKKRGDTGDINLFLVTALRAANLTASPVILSTRANGPPHKDFAILDKFNYLIASARLNGEDILLDATDHFLSAGMLPINCLNGFGRIIDPPNSRFVSLTPTQKASETKVAQLTLTQDGELHGTLTQSAGGYGAWLLKKVVATHGDSKLVQTLREAQESWQIHTVNIAKTDSGQLSFAANYTLSVTDAILESGDRIYLQPMISAGRDANPLKSPNRQFPVDIATPIEENHLFTITLPADYVVETVPNPVAISLPDNGGRFIFQVNASGNQLQVTSRFVLRKQIYQPSDYASLRAFFGEAVSKHAERVVLRKASKN